MITLFVQPDCMICAIVQPVIEAIAQKHGLELVVTQDAVPAYPAVLFEGRLLIGENAPRELEKLIAQTNKSRLKAV